MMPALQLWTIKELIEAAPMGDCDDYSDEKIRLYALLRRMIILTALIVTVSVMNWTITALAPAYVAILQHVASTVSPDDQQSTTTERR
jgi:hypothetical protein